MPNSTLPTCNEAWGFYGSTAGQDRSIFARVVSTGERATGIVQYFQFVIAHQRDPAIWQGETAHAVAAIWNGAAIVHRIAHYRDYAIGKPGWKVEQPVGVGHQRAIGQSGGGRRNARDAAAGE